jgi:hypothetical protein
MAISFGGPGATTFGQRRPEEVKKSFSWVKCQAFQTIYSTADANLNTYQEAMYYAYSMLGEAVVSDQGRVIERANAMREARNAFSNACRLCEDGELTKSLDALMKVLNALVTFYDICEHV